MIEPVLNECRLAAEECDNLQGFLLHHSVSGGSGSGLTKNLMEQLPNYFGKKSVVNFSIQPEFPESHSCVSAYNTILFNNFANSEYSKVILCYVKSS